MLVIQIALGIILAPILFWAIVTLFCGIVAVVGIPIMMVVGAVNGFREWLAPAIKPANWLSR